MPKIMAGVKIQMMTNSMIKSMTAIQTVQSKKRIPSIREFLNMDVVLLEKRDSRGKMYRQIMA